MTLVDKVVIITGAGQGIGAQFARAFAAAGATVVIADLNSSKAEQVAQELRDGGATALGVQVDVSDRTNATAMVDQAVTAFGGVDILVNNASIFSTIRMGPFEEITPEEWRTLMTVNLDGTFFCSQAVAPAMRARQGGAIVNVSSGTVLMGRPNYAHYVSSKAGVLGMTRALANELGADNIRVNAIMPGSVETEIPRGTVTPEQAAGIVSRQALKRRLVPDDIAGVAVFLASDAARMITGQSLVVDGGVVFQ